MMSTPNVQIVAGPNLGNATFSRPVRQRRDTRQSTLSTLAIHAIRLNNEIVGDLGQVLPVPATNRSLFSPTPRNPTHASTPSTLEGTASQTPSTPRQPPPPPG